LGRFGGGVRFVSSRELGAQFVELFYGGIALAQHRLLIAEHELDRISFIGEGGEGDGEAGGWIVALVLPGDLGGLLVHFEDEHGGFGAGGDALVTELGHGGLFDEAQFDVVGGLEAGAEVGDQFFKDFRFFNVEADAFGEEAVLDGVPGGALFAFGGDGAAGFRSVDAGGFGFCKFGHGDYSLNLGRRTSLTYYVGGSSQGFARKLMIVNKKKDCTAFSTRRF